MPSQYCCRWHQNLSLWQPQVPPATIELAPWQSHDFRVGYTQKLVDLILNITGTCICLWSDSKSVLIQVNIGSGDALLPVHICVSKLTIIGSDNGLSPRRRQAIIWTNAGILLIGPLGTNFSEILIEIHTFSCDLPEQPLHLEQGWLITPHKTPWL